MPSKVLMGAALALSGDELGRFMVWGGFCDTQVEKLAQSTQSGEMRGLPGPFSYSRIPADLRENILEAVAADLSV